MLYQFSINWGRVTHICASELTINGSDCGLSLDRRQAIIWTDAGLLLIWSFGTNFGEILEICISSFKKMHLKCRLRNVCHFVSALSYWGKGIHISVSKLTIIGSGNGLSPGRHQTIIWTILDWALRNKLQWNLNRNSYIFIQENAFENVVRKMSAIFLGLNVLRARTSSWNPTSWKKRTRAPCISNIVVVDD